MEKVWVTYPIVQKINKGTEHFFESSQDKKNHRHTKIQAFL